jgi:glutathione synthase/RimK-type ligase-like ATP-grasp enzyme
MILIISAEDDTHVPRVTRRLEALGAEYLWFNPARFPAESEIRVAYERSGLTSQLLRFRDKDLDLATVTGVWDRRPELPTAAPNVTGEVQRRWISLESGYCLAGVWENMPCRWIPGKPRAISAAQNKVRLLAVAAQLGFHIPRTLITNRPESLLEFYSECDGRLVTKVLRDGLVYQGTERYMAYTHAVRRRDLANYRAVRYAPLIMQEYVPKQLELRINVVGAKVFAAEIDSQASPCTKHDWRHYDNDRATYAPHVLPAAIDTLCVRLVRALGLSFGAIDMVLTPAGEYVFLEINPTGQWGWVEHLTGLPISAAIAELLVQGGGENVEREFDGPTH